MTGFKIIQGDCIAVMSAATAESIDAIVCDPPYGIEFMGNTWDSPGKMLGAATGVSGGFQGIEKGVHRPDMAKCDGELFAQWCEAWATEALRVLKPGGHLLAFGGTRMWHHLATGIERAGFEIRESIMWIYGQGMPKSKKIAGYDGWKEPSLKPAVEPIVVARKPLRIPGKRPGTTKKANLKQNMDHHGVGAYNIDAVRIPSDGSHIVSRTVTKRANVAGDIRTESAAGMYAAGSSFEPTNHEGGRFPANVMIHEDVAEEPLASYFYVAKASKADRDFGLEGATPRSVMTMNGGVGAIDYSPVGSDKPAGREALNFHPTVKPIALMQQLILLVTPEGGVVLDPFCGSGSTGVAALRLGYKFVGIEMEQNYIDIALARCTAALQEEATA